MRKNSNERGYGARWQRARLIFLAEKPLCKYCEKQGKLTAANVVDHIKPHKGDSTLFWSVDNWQALCSHCHDSLKKQEEHGKIVHSYGLDGWPIARLEFRF